jgi:diadenylate cyclase
MHIFSIFTPFIEILIIAVIFNYLLSFFWNTRSMDVVWGFFAFLALTATSSWLKLPVLHTIMMVLGNAAVVAILIIFQPELRTALSKLSLKGKQYKGFSELDNFLEGFATTVYKLADKKIGALIAIEHEDSLDEYAQKGVLLNSVFSVELLETIFATNTPLHDGAVIIRGTNIIAAAVILPLVEEDPKLAKSMGTRHRAALGLSQQSDAIVVVVSEETGRVSVVRDGIMTPGIKIDRFKGIMRSLFTPPATEPFKNKFNLVNWLRK